MKTIILIIILSLTTVFSNAANPVWFRGSVVLENGNVQTGYITIELNFDLVLLKNEAAGNARVFPAHKIRAVFFYDSLSHINRKFITVQLSGEVYKPYTLYEVVLQGQVSLLRRRDITNDAQLPGDDGFDYFVRVQDNFTPLKRFRTKIYPALLHTSLNGFSDYIRKNRLNPNDQSNAIRIIQCYNEMYVHQMLSMR